MRTRALSRWLLGVTRPVLGPMLGSTVFRHVDHLLGLALMGIGAGAVAGLAARLAGLDAPGWLPGNLWVLALALAGIALGKGVARYLEHFLGHLVAFKALELLRVELYRGLAPQAPTLDPDTTSGDLLNRATKDIDRIEVFFAHTFPPAVTAVTVPLIGVGVIGAIGGWPVALVTLAGVALALVVPWIGARSSLAAANATADARGELTQHVTDSLQGMAEVTGYGHTDARLAELGDLDDAIARAGAPRAFHQSLREALHTAVMAATTVAVAAVGASTGLGVVALAVVVALAFRCFDSTAGVKDFAGSLDNSMAAARRVHAIATAAPRVADPADPESLPAGALGVRWDGVGYRYPGVERELALDGVSVDVPAGSHCCFVGLSGSGKTTALQLLLRFDDPTAGRISLGGVDVRDVALDDLRARVAMVSQSTQLFAGSAASNLRLAVPDAADEQLWEVLEVAQLADVVRERGLDADLGEGGAKLSGGQRQRLALARALLARPDVLVLDECTAHLDPELAARVLAAIRGYLPGATILESTHTVAGLEAADQIVVLEGGRVVQAGAPSEVLGTGFLGELLARELDRVG